MTIWHVQSVGDPGDKEDPGDWFDRKATAYDAQSAAVKVAEAYFWDDPDGDNPTVRARVRADGTDDAWKIFRVIGEPTMHFSAYSDDPHEATDG